MTDAVIANALNAAAPTIEAHRSQYESRAAEIAATLQGLIDRLDRTIADIDRVLNQ